MKNKLKIFVMCFVLLCMSLFTGCSLVETNNSKLYNTIVAEIYDSNGKKVAEVTNRELYSGYENFGSSYVQYYNYSVRKAVDMTLRQIENRKITILTAENEFKIDYKTGEGLTNLEKTYIYEQTVDSLNKNLDGYYEEIVGSTSEDNNTSDEIKFNDYIKNVTLEVDDKGNYYIKNIEKENGVLDGYKPLHEKSYYNLTDKAEIYDNFLVKALADEKYEKALKYYIIDLQSAELNMNFSDKTTKAIFEREIERLYKINYENYIVEKYSEHLRLDSQTSSVTTEDILNLYSSKVRAGYTQYEIEGDSGYGEDISGSLNSVYYFKNNADTKYFKVANILFKFDDKQTTQYEAIEKKAQGSDIYLEYESDMNDLYSSLRPVIREYNEESGIYEGEKVEDVTVDSIIENKIKPALKAAQSSQDVNVVGDTINDFIYIYNEDTGMFNAEANYVIGVDKDGKAVSSFVDSFNQAGLDLYNNGNGKIGDVAVCRSNYGVHVLVYTGICENLFDGIDENFDLSGTSEGQEGKQAIEVLYSTRVNLLVDKTYFDLLFDEIYKDNFTYYEQANLNFLRDKYDFKVYRGRFPKTLKG